jgi:hypothetical protein
MNGSDALLADRDAADWLAAVLRGEGAGLDRLDPAILEQRVGAAVQHGVAPLLHHVLARSEAWEHWPSGSRETVTRPAQHAMALEMWRSRDLGELLERFEAAGIRYLLMKGGGLAYTHYEQPYLRDRCDTDLLFADQAAFDRAWALLESLGYRRRATLSGDFVGYQHCCWKPLGSGIHQILDCHIRVNDYAFFAEALSFDEAMANSVAVPELAPSARTLGPVHALLLACMHLVATIPMGDAGRLIWLHDLRLLADSFEDDDWERFLTLARERSICGSCRHSLEAAVAFFPVNVPDEVMAALRTAADGEPFKPGEDMKRWRYYLQVFRSTRGVGGKARLLREHFIPAPDYLMAKYGTTNRLALPWLYVHRVFAGLRRYF